MKFQYRNTHITTKIPFVIKRMIFQSWKILNDIRLRNNIGNNQIIIFGYPKSGSTAISYLLSEALNLSYSAELKSLIFKPQLLEDLSNRDLSYNKFTHLNRLDYSKAILKECFLSYFMKETIENFPNSKFLYVRRNLKDNIRSILNRLNLKGDDSSDLESVPLAWQYFLEPQKFNPTIKATSSSYVKNLALGWKHVESEYMKYSDRIELINYEDFCKNKANVILNTANKLGYEIENNIENIVDVNYNIVGQKNTNLKNFFGYENYKLLDSMEKESLINK